MRATAFAVLLALAPTISHGYTGPVVDASAYPSTVFLDLDRGQTERQRCTAVAIGPRAVLTAAHCVGEFVDHRWGCLLRGASVLIGAAGRPKTAHTVRLVAPHPSVAVDSRQWWEFWRGLAYDGTSDVAVLVFETDHGFPAASFADSVTRRQQIKVGGHGQPLIDAPGYSDDLRMGDHVVGEFIGNQFRVGHHGYRGFNLHGDSGGPVYERHTRLVVGINSWHQPDRSEPVPVPGSTRDAMRVVNYISVASRTDVIRDWIAAAAIGRAGSVRCPFTRPR